MNELQLKEKLNDLKKDLMKYNAQISTGTVPENPGRIKLVRKTIAKIYTAINAKRHSKTIKEVNKEKINERMPKVRSR